MGRLLLGNRFRSVTCGKGEVGCTLGRGIRKASHAEAGSGAHDVEAEARTTRVDAPSGAACLRSPSSPSQLRSLQARAATATGRTATSPRRSSVLRTTL